MSKAYRIDKDGIIIEELVAWGSYEDAQGKVIKPKSAIEEQMLIAYSEQQKKIKALGIEERPQHDGTVCGVAVSGFERHISPAES